MNGNIEEYVYIHIHIYRNILYMFWMEYGNATKVGTLVTYFATMLHTYVRSNRNKFIQLTLGSHTTHVLVLTGNGQVPQIAKEHRDGNTIEKTQENDLNVRRTFREIQYPCVSLFVNWRHHDRAKKHAAMSQLGKTLTAGSSHNVAHIVHMGVSEHGLYQNTTIALFAAENTSLHG